MQVDSFKLPTFLKFLHSRPGTRRSGVKERPPKGYGWSQLASSVVVLLSMAELPIYGATAANWQYQSAFMVAEACAAYRILNSVPCRARTNGFIGCDLAFVVSVHIAPIKFVFTQ